MDFKIEFPINTPDSPIRIDDKFFFAGSCFAENMSKKTNEICLNQEFINHGILFNPASISIAIKQILNEEIPDDSSILEFNQLYFSWNHHGSVYHTEKQKLIEDIIIKNKNQKEKLIQSNYLILSFGSAFVYENKKLNKIVANCHKVPSSEFIKRRLSVEEIVLDWEDCINLIQKLNPKIKIIFTVSPVKYLKDGIHENNLSKSTLLLAVNELIKRNNCSYFPAFEILQDELRDYRFYNSDMAHPSEQAIDYIWDRFVNSQFDIQSINNIRELQQLRLMRNHRILHEGSLEHQKFMINLDKKENELKSKFPFLNWKNI